MERFDCRAVMRKDDWLDGIPKDWEQVPLKYLVSCDNSGVWGEEEGILEKNIPICTTAHLDKSGNLNFDEMPVRSLSMEEYEYYRLQPGDIIVVKSSGSGSNIITGKSALFKESMPEFTFGNFLLRLRPNSKINPLFLYFFISSGITAERIRRMVSATTYPNLRVEEYLLSLIPLPPKEEQDEIAAKINSEIERIDLANQALKNQIENLAEMRNSIITRRVLGRSK